MAIFNKLFTSRRNNSNNQDNASENFGFAREQIRVVLFRECDFRGRKLLFDSTAIKKIQICPMENDYPCSSLKDKSDIFAEISDGCGYMYVKPPTDCSHLAEMIFGLVAMSYRGSYFKIHNLETPARLMFTQVFPSPKYAQGRNSSTSSHERKRFSNQSLEHSIRLDDSGTSISDHLSVHSTASDTLLVCKRSMPLDVPQKLSESSSSVICDSGVYGDRSCSSFDGNRLCAVPFWDSLPIKGSAISFSNSTLYKRWLRRSSLDHSGCSSNGSMDETFSKPHQRSSKLGLAFIIHLTAGKEESQLQFFMEHIALLESMLWRARQAAEVAYLRPNNFLSVLVKMVNITSTWLTNLISGPTLPLNLWTSLYSNNSDISVNSDNINNCADCDNNNSINSVNYQKVTRETFRSFLNTSNVGHFGNFSDETMKSDNLLSNSQNEKSEFSFFNITRIIKNEWDNFHLKLSGNSDGNDLAEKFVHEFCELLDTIDVKDTNFFISTLLTAVLTHHLGWVTTCLPADGDHDILDLNTPYNPLWGQLSDLYGAVGHPTKMTQTIIIGNKKKDIVVKIINCLTYFIRCCDLKRNHFIRSHIYEDNETVNYICCKNSCIPKENYKKYKDHLREMLNSNSCLDNALNNDDTSNKSRNLPKEVEQKIPRIGLYRTKKSHFDLKTLEMDVEQDIYHGSKTHGLSKNSNFTNLKDFEEAHEDSCLNIHSNIKIESLSTLRDDVVFVIGDDEKLIDIKKGEKIRKDSESKKKNLKTVEKNDSSSKESKPNFLDLIFKKYETFEEEFSKSSFKDEDFIKYETDFRIKPSTSWASLKQAEEDLSTEVNTEVNSESQAACSIDKRRAQSVPPEEKTVKEEVKAKYRYSGVKFSLHQYPQVVTNYMRSKNLEMANLPFSVITKKFDQISLEDEEDNVNFSKYDVNSEEMEALQTPSNASELEFTSDLTIEMNRHKHARESSEKPSCNTSIISNVIKEDVEKYSQELATGKKESPEGNSKMKIIYFPMPKSVLMPKKTEWVTYPISLMRGLNDTYIPDLVLQGTLAPKREWESSLRSELALASQHCLLDQRLEEAVAIIADTDTWEVQLVSSHTYVIDKSSSGVRVGMSHLIASMLDSLLKMWRLQVPPHLCLMHIEQRLQALCVRSKALAQLLLATEFCSMEFLTSTLHLEVNDVPLLLAVASTYSPQVTQKYGISFQ
ncbi:hypothetical protein HHI36_006781 [Cryptolaemus montrouzieri]|uniref:UDENN FNIP1/2-type domain-containing protein n=1 Tax=Cryptolaemus montrouzieri TaxID=559131 RepID=A0ABD2NY68_9CUCU